MTREKRANPGNRANAADWTRRVGKSKTARKTIRRKWRCHSSNRGIYGSYTAVIDSRSKTAIYSGTEGSADCWTEAATHCRTKAATHCWTGPGTHTATKTATTAAAETTALCKGRY
jgi:hypothetical protein